MAQEEAEGCFQAALQVDTGNLTTLQTYAWIRGSWSNFDRAQDLNANTLF